MTPTVPYEVSDRGFVHWTPVPTTYGHDVKVYESSAATDPPCMWLAVDKDGEDQCAHLTYEQVTQVYARIGAWLQRHHDAGARWAADRYAAELQAQFDMAAPVQSEQR